MQDGKGASLIAEAAGRRKVRVFCMGNIKSDQTDLTVRGLKCMHDFAAPPSLNFPCAAHLGHIVAWPVCAQAKPVVLAMWLGGNQLSWKHDFRDFRRA